MTVGVEVAAGFMAFVLLVLGLARGVIRTYFREKRNYLRDMLRSEDDKWLK